MNYEVTMTFKNGMRLVVPVFVDYDEETEDFDFLIIEDAMSIVSEFNSELTNTRLRDLIETVDVDRK
jgi:hypothetical protein